MEVYLLIPLLWWIADRSLCMALAACVRLPATFWWGLASLVLPPLGLWFALRHSQQAVRPLVLLVAAGVVIAGSALYLLAVPTPTALQKKPGQESRLWSLTSEALRSDPVHEWVESRSYFLQIGAMPVAACAWIWLLVRAFRQQRAWGWSSPVHTARRACLCRATSSPGSRTTHSACLGRLVRRPYRQSIFCAFALTLVRETRTSVASAMSH